MNTHPTNIELCGEEYAAVVLFEWDKEEWKGRPLIGSVSIGRNVKEFYTSTGEYKPRVNLVSLDITPLLNETQFSALADEIIAEATCRNAEDKAEDYGWKREAE